MSVVILVADGARPDMVARELEAGALPALARLREEGGLFTVTSVFPTTTGPAYTPFLMGRYPGAVGLPGIRWYDRSRTLSRVMGHSRSYCGIESRMVNADLAPDAPTVFELAGPSLNAWNSLDRGLTARERIGYSVPFALRAARTHFSGDIGAWLRIDRDMSRRFVRRVREERPAYAFCALTGVDKTSHGAGHDSDATRGALRIVDETAAAIRADAERDGRWEETHLWVVSDHGHSPVRWHDDLAAVMRGWGVRTIAHPWILRARPEAAVMVSGNAMAHIYVDLDAPERPFDAHRDGRWGALVEKLLERPSVDLVLVPHSPWRCEVRARGRGAALIEMSGCRYAYRPVSGDPLGVGEHAALTADEAYEATIASDYPDGIVQIVHLAGAARSGEIILSAAREWDFRAKYEPIPHVSSHGALHREHMLVPLLVNRPVAGLPRRTVDIMPSTLAALGVEVPAGLDGRSFL